MTLDEVYESLDVPREPPRPSLRRVREPDAQYAADALLDEGLDAAPAHAD